MSQVFEDAASFNRPLSQWNVANVEDFPFMFRGALSFNQDLSNWSFDRASKLDLRTMFGDATSFNQNLCRWGLQFTSVSPTMNSMFSGTNCSSQADPDLSMDPPGPFCAICQ